MSLGPVVCKKYISTQRERQFLYQLIECNVMGQTGVSDWDIAQNIEIAVPNALPYLGGLPHEKGGDAPRNF